MVTTVTKSVGTTGRDYSTIAAAVAALPSNLVTADQAWIFEIYNDSEFNENLTLSGHTTDATRNITFRPGPGQGFGDSAGKLTNALRYNRSNGVGIRLPGDFVASSWIISDQYVTIDGLQFNHRDAAETKHLIQVTAANVLLKNCIVQNDSAFNLGGSLVSISVASRMVNCLGIEANPTQSNRGGFSPQDNGAVLIACGAIRTALTGNGSAYYRDYSTPLIRNCWAFGWQKFGKDTTGAAGSGYNATDVASGNVPGSNNVYSLTPSAQLTSVTSGSVDARVKIGSSLINAGTRDQTYTSDLDIVNSARSTTTPTIGSWEYSAGDTTAPTLSSPTGSATGTTTATVGATTDEGNGTLYAVVTTSATAPTKAQVKAGQNAAGSAANWSGSVAVSSTGAKTLNATGLTASTAYYAHLMHEDAATNQSNVVSSTSFTTSAGASGSKGRFYYQFGSPQC